MFSNKHKTVSIILAASLTATALTACGSATGETLNSRPATSATETVTTETSASGTAPAPTETSPETTVEESTYATATETTVADLEYVRAAYGVTPEMMDSEFWIDEDDNVILMTEEEIAQFNYENRVHVKSNDGTEMPFFDEFEETIDGDLLRLFLNDNAAAVPSSPSNYYLNGSPTTKSYWDNLVALSNIDGVPDEIEVRYGFTVLRTTLRMYPTEDRVFSSPDDRFFDSILYSECMPYMPVYVLHESTDGEYLYVVFDSFAAWVQKDAVALCSSKEDWLARQNPGQWLVVTAREIRLGDDPYVEATKDLVLPMGTRMELVPASDAPYEISQRTTYCDYVVKVPTRGSDGYIKDEYVLIPVSDDVSAGFLPLTSANIIRQAFKLLGDRYGWGGDLRANDCTGITREIYRCFGVLLPRVGQSNSKGIYKVDLSGMSDEEKLAVIEDLAPGSLISFPGHMMIYLGTVDGVPYVMSAVGTFVAPEGGSDEQIHPRSVVITSLYVRSKSLYTWLSIATTALTIKPG